MKILIASFVVLFVLLVNVRTASATQECYGFSKSTNQVNSQTWVRYLQTFTPTTTARIVSIALNIYSEPASSGNHFIEIVETTGGVPNNMIIAGSQVSKPIADFPQADVGLEQAFDCENIPEIQVFTFVTPLQLTVGQTYAVSWHETSTGNKGRLGYVAGFPSVAPGIGWKCSGVLVARCDTTEMELNEFPGGSGINWDVVFSIQNEFIDGDAITGGKINNHIETFRDWLSLGDTTGGTIFSLAVVSAVFGVGIFTKVNFIIMALVNVLLVGAFAREEIMEPWILIAVVAVAGLGTVFTLAGQSDKGSQE